MEGVSREDPAADPHPAQPHPRPDLLLPHSLMGSLDGKVAVVTGAAQGIGRALADGLAAEGARIVVADLRDAEEAATSYDGGRGVPFLLHYVTSKGAIVAFTRALAKELGKDKVLVNCVAPGFTMSAGVQAHPEVIEKLRDVSVAARTIQRDQVPEDVVGAVVYFCGPASDFVTGQTIVIDGGQTFH